MKLAKELSVLFRGKGRKVDKKVNKFLSIQEQKKDDHQHDEKIDHNLQYVRSNRTGLLVKKKAYVLSQVGQGFIEDLGIQFHVYIIALQQFFYLVGHTAILQKVLHLLTKWHAFAHLIQAEGFLGKRANKKHGRNKDKLEDKQTCKKRGQ